MTQQLLSEQSHSRISALEAQLNASQSLAEQLELLSSLVEEATFSNPERAQQYLETMAHLLNEAQGNVWAYHVLYELQVAFLENQLYNYTLSENHYRKALSLLSQQPASPLRVMAMLDFAATLSNLQKFEEVGGLLREVEALLQSHVRTDNRLLFHFYLRSGYFALNLGELTDAIRHFMQAEDIFALIPPSELGSKDWYLLSLLYAGKGHVYERDGEPEQEITAFKKAIEICEQKGLRTRLSWNYLNMGNSYMRLQEVGLAKKYFYKTIHVEDDLNKQSRASALANLGRLALAENRFEEANEYLHQAKAIYQSRRQPDHGNMALLHMWFGELYFQRNDYVEAEEHYLRAWKAAEAGQRDDLLVQLCQAFAELYEVQEDYETAYGYLKVKDGFLANYQAAMRHGKVRELELKYDLERRRREAEELRSQTIHLRLQALRAQMNPHFIFNVMSCIQSIVREGDSKNADEFLHRFSILMRQSLNFSEVDFVTLEEEVEFLRNYLIINSKLRFMGKMEGRIALEEELPDEVLYLPSMIIQPLVENAVEHGIRPLQDRKGIVEVTFSWFDETNILCQIRDNGIGRAAAKQRSKNRPKKHKSRGMEIVRDRLKILHDERGFTTQPLRIIDLTDPATNQPMGTLVEVILPTETTPPSAHFNF